MYFIYTRYSQVVVSIQAVPNSITTFLSEITQYDGTILQRMQKYLGMYFLIQIYYGQTEFVTVLLH